MANMRQFCRIRPRPIPARRELALHGRPEVLDIEGYAALRSNDLP